VAIEGGDGVTAVRLKSLADGSERSLSCAGVFPYVGLAPAVEFLPSGVQRDPAGALVTSTTLETSMPGVYACGAVRAGFGGRLGDAVRDATRVADELAVRLSE
jgi:thioredoxin reductase (NADPH)